MNLKTMTIGATAASFIAVAALAHSGATGVMKERMDGMGVMAAAIKRVAPMFLGEINYDADAVRDAAEAIKVHAGDTMTKLFPEGSNDKPSEAKNTIWTNWDEFAVLAGQLETYAEGLSLAAGNGFAFQDGAGMGGMMGGAAMMGGNTMMHDDSSMAGMMTGHQPMMGVEELAEMPVDAVFTMVSQTCSACHTRFRAEK